LAYPECQDIHEEEHFMNRPARRLFAGLAAATLAVSAVGTVAAQSPSAPAASEPAGSPGAGGSYHIGVSNWLQGNGWREQMICSIKAQALASGQVDQLTILHRTTDAAGQLEDLRNLINSGVDAIIVNPISPDGLNAAITEAIDAGITVVAVDLAVTEPNAYLVANDQEEYGYLGARWLFENLGGEGSVFYMRGAAGTSADTDRDAGFKRAQEEYPGITIAQEVFTNWDIATGAQQINDFIASGATFDGIWTSGIDSTIVDALKTAGVPFVPVVGADNSGFVAQLLTEEGLVGAAVTNSAAVGGAGLTRALEILNGQIPEEKALLTTPVAYDNVSEEGKAGLAGLRDGAEDIDATWPLVYDLPPLTTYTKEQLLACADI
jgi:ribose transport system substrate-binding protein